VKTRNNPSTSDVWLSLKSSKKSVTFEVTACNNARLKLAQRPFGTVKYEVIVGAEGNSLTRILSYDDSGSSEQVAERDTPGIIDCSELRRFTVSWMSDKIQLSSGSMSGRVIIDWRTDQNKLALFAVGLATGPGSTGDWKFSSSEGLPCI
jgi:Farnesoic acid 0-methyl transferase